MKLSSSKFKLKMISDLTEVELAQRANLPMLVQEMHMLPSFHNQEITESDSWKYNSKISMSCISICSFCSSLSH